MENNLSREELYELIKQAVRDVLREENIKLKPNGINDVETVSQEEMEDIINTHGKPFIVPGPFLNPIKVDNIEKFERDKLYDR
jgi:hypothetical protein